MSFFEIRQYKPFPGKADAWIKAMHDLVIPFQVSKGMVICASFRGETDESVYIWIRRFESEEQRVAQYKAVYESSEWLDVIRPAIAGMLDPSGKVVTRVVATGMSVLQ
jgi:hypothetical protein